MGSGAVLSGLFALGLHAYGAYFPLTLSEAAHRGLRLEIQLDPRSCDQMYSELNCESPYIGNLVVGKNLWTFSGRKKDSSAVERNDANNAPHEMGILSLWGVLLRFDNEGRLSFEGNPVGTVRLIRRDD